MDEPLRLQHHAEALLTLGVEPHFDAEAAARIERAEAATGRRLPAAVREWYTLAGAEGVSTYGDEACGAACLGDIIDRFSGRPLCRVLRPDPGEHGVPRPRPARRVG